MDRHPYPQVDYRKWVFFLVPMNVVDLVAILPFYFELLLTGVAVPGLSVFRALRLTRMLRVLKVSKKSLKVRVRSPEPLRSDLFALRGEALDGFPKPT
jgi:hypothetical protein